MTAFEAVLHIGVIPMSVERPSTDSSNAEIRRWLDQKAVIINGVRPTSKQEIEFPIEQLIFFPKSNRRTTVI